MKLNEKLIYFKNNISELEIVDDSLRPDFEGRQLSNHVGAYASIITTNIQGTEEIFIIYQEGTDSDVVIARRHTNSWTKTTLSGNESQFEGAKGFFASSVLSDIDPAEAIIANYVITPGGESNHLELFKISLLDIP